jgi:PAS domain S-box-containing protein
MQKAKQAHFRTLQPKLADLIRQGSDIVFDKWSWMLRERFGAGSEQKVLEVSESRKEGTDLLSIFTGILLSEVDCDSKVLQPIFKKIWSLDYSISDFFTETACLKDALSQYLQSVDTLAEKELLYGVELLSREVNQLFSKVLNECSLLFEHIAENSKTGFCQTDTEGRITFANREMHRLSGRPSLIGVALEDLFDGGGKDFVRNALRQDSKNSQDLRSLFLKPDNGQAIPVGIEIGPVVIDGQYRGGYAHITDISKHVELQNRIFDRALMGIIKLDLKGNITFANKSMLQLVGLEDWRNRSVQSFLPDQETWDLVKQKLGERIVGGQSDEYELNIRRVSDQQLVPVKVSAFPETDLSGKRIIGSFAIVHSIVSDKIHQHIETLRNENALLEAVAGELRVLIPFDLMSVSEYSTDLQHIRSFFLFVYGAKPTWERRWWEMTPARNRWARQEDVIIVDDLDTFFQQSEWEGLREEPDIQWLFQQGFRSFVFYPITRDNRLVAAVSLMTKSKGVYREHHKALIKNLPLDMAVHMALYYHQKREMTFISGLIGYISGAGSDVKQIRRVIVKQVAEHYDWKSVALYKVDKKRGKICLLEQSISSGKYKLPENYEQDVSEGVLGYVYRKGTLVNIGDVTTDPEFKDIYKAAINGGGIRSELCLPINFGEVQWLLNVEDSHINAFSKEEENAIARVMDEVQGFFEKSWLSHFLEASLGATSDTVFVVDGSANIVQANPAAIEMFDIEVAEKPEQNRDAGAGPRGGAIARVTPKPLLELFSDPEGGARIARTGQVPQTAVTLKRADGGTIPVLLSSVDLQEDFGYLIFAAADLSAQKRVEEIENLGKVFFEIATQTKTPLSLAYGWLSRLKRQMPGGGQARETLDKVVRQLGKLELTYNRLVLYAADQEAMPYNGLLLDIAEVLEGLCEELPEAEAEKISWPEPEKGLYVYGDLFQLRFCFETILAHLLRFVPQESKIGLRVFREGNGLVAEFRGWHPQPLPRPGTGGKPQTALARALVDMAFGEKVIRSFIIDNHGGTYEAPEQTGDVVLFRFTLPLVED